MSFRPSHAGVNTWGEEVVKILKYVCSITGSGDVYVCMYVRMCVAYQEVEMCMYVCM